MPADVRERLARHLHDVLSERGELSGDVLLYIHYRHDAALLLELLGQLADRLVEVPVGEGPGAQAEYVVAGGAGRSVALFACAPAAPRRVGLGPPGSGTAIVATSARTSSRARSATSSRVSSPSIFPERMWVAISRTASSHCSRSRLSPERR